MTLPNLFKIRHVSVKDKTLFTRSLSATIEAGLPILKAVTIVTNETSNSYLKEIGSDICDRLERGEKLSTALSKFPNVFDQVYVSSVAAAEASGRMEEILKDLADRQENEYKVESALKSAVAYPLFVFFAMIVVTLFLLAAIVPRLKDIIKDMNIGVPPSTQLLLDGSAFVARFWYIILLSIIGLVIWLRMFSKTEFGKLFFSRLAISLPVIRSMYINIYMNRFAKTFLTLSTAGVPLLRSIKLVSQVINNKVISHVLEKTYQDVERGLPMSEPLSKSHAFPQLVSQMIAVGEQTGKLDEVYRSLSELYEGESERNISLITSMLEPILLLIVGILIGLIVFSIVIPIYQATNSI